MNRFTRFLAGTLMASTAFAGMADSFVGARDDFRDETIYFAMTTRFYDGDPTNNVLCWDGVQNQVQNNDPCWRGDFKGLIDKLDYIKALGFTAIWITPIVQNASGFDYHGYHAMDFSSVDVRYNSKTEWGASEDVDFQKLIDKAHDKGIKIILDIVLQHTGNFGEKKFAHLFDRDQNIKSQASIEKCMIPTDILGGDNYWKLDPNTQQYPERFKYLKNTDGQNHDTNNYWHHVANAWNWDEPSRWWGQIAGDCVDLNTENPAVVDYLVECYGKFIKMGVDGFRIDTTGHIAPLTFNAAFIPAFEKLGKENQAARKSNTPFYMFGECCARYGSVVYRDQHLLSSHYYTWKSDQALVNEWNQYTASWWAQQNVPEGASPLGNMLTCLKDPGTVHNSNNVFMQNGAWHDVDYSQASGFNVIDFPMHYNFNSASQAMEIARNGDKYYNDASYNVVYVDSHDYCPGPNDGVRFSGGTSQWAENLSMMFTFRGIPCIYYGSEVEFQKGVKIDEGPALALKNSGRAYFGNYIEGKVTASDYGVYKCDDPNSNVAKTLNADLAQHIRRLNLLRAAVPALRKGQYTFDGCSANGGYAYKRHYKANGEDSYCLVALNGGATFTNVPSGTYTDIVTGKTYSGTSITVDAPKTQGQLRILVKDWKGASKQVGEHGKFIYDTTPVNHGGSVKFDDPGTKQYYTANDAPAQAGITLTPGSGTFKTATIDVTIALNDAAASGWYKVGANGTKVNLNKGQQKTVTIGNGMNYGDSVTIYWGITDASGSTREGTATYKKVDPNKSITVGVACSGNFNLYAWGKNGSGETVEPLGAWPGSKPVDIEVHNGETFYCYSFDDMASVNVIMNNSGKQTSNFEGITDDTYFKYDGASNAEKVNIEEQPEVILTPGSCTFDETLTITASLKNATSGTYKVGNAASKSFTNTATFTIGENVKAGESVTVTWTATDGNKNNNGSYTYTKKTVGGGDDPDPNSGELTIKGDYNFAYTGSYSHVHYWGGASQSTWPGVALTSVKGSDGNTYKCAKLPENTSGLVFNNNGNGQSGDLTHKAGYVHNDSGATDKKVVFKNDGGNDQDDDEDDPTAVYVYVDGWDNVHSYIYKDGAGEVAAWPGSAMTKDTATGYWKYEVPSAFHNSLVIINTGANGANRYPADMEPGLKLEGKSMIFRTATSTWEEFKQQTGVEELIDLDEEPIFFTLQGVRVQNPQSGIYIVRRGNKTAKVILK